MNARFVGELDLRYLDEPIDGKWFITLNSFSYIDNLELRYTIPKGVKTDFASIPRTFRFLISRFGRHGKSAVFHDWLCEFKIVNRKKADRLFLESMKVLGVGWLKRRTMYTAVRAYSIVSRKK